MPNAIIFSPFKNARNALQNQRGIALEKIRERKTGKIILENHAKPAARRARMSAAAASRRLALHPAQR
jgi:hypothetical protein